MYPKFFVVSAICVFFFSFCKKDNTSAGGGGNNPSPSLPLTEIAILDTAYGANASQKMDIYLPANRSKRTRVVLMLHGGGWQAGDKAEFNYYKNLLRAKWPEAAVVNINYRLASNSANIHATEIMSDITAAINLVVTNKNYFTISDTMAIMGESAGAHLAMQYAYTQNTNGYIKCVGDIYGPAKLDDWSWYSSTLINGIKVSDLISTYAGAAWNVSLYQSLSPISTVNANSPPTIIFHGTIDLVVPLYQSQWMHNRLVALGVPNEYYEYFLDGHGFNSTNANDCATKMVAFFKAKMN